MPTDRILDAWAEGKKVREIAEMITRGSGQRYTVSSIERCIWRARKAGDPRATYRKPNDGRNGRKSRKPAQPCDPA